MASMKSFVWANGPSVIHRLKTQLPLTVTLCKSCRKKYFPKTWDLQKSNLILVRNNPEPTPVLYIQFPKLFESSSRLWSFLSIMLWVFSKAMEKKKKEESGSNILGGSSSSTIFILTTSISTGLSCLEAYFISDTLHMQGFLIFIACN